MSRTLLQPRQSSRSINNNPFNSFKINMNNYTEVMIQTNDQEVPYIAIYKPDVKRQQRRVQAITSIQKGLRKAELFRMSYVFGKLNLLKHQEQKFQSNANHLQYLLTKLVKKRMNQTFFQLFATKIKKNNHKMAAKILSNFEKRFTFSLTKNSMNKLKFNSYRILVNTLQDQNEMSSHMNQINDQLFILKQGAFSQQFLDKSKTLLKLSDNSTFVNNLHEINFQEVVKAQLERFQQTKKTSKRKELFQNEQIIKAFSNSLKAYDGLISEHLSYEDQLKQQLEGYTNTQGIEQLKETLRQRDASINDIDSFTNQITKMDTELKRFSGEKLNSDKILSLISTHQKRLEGKVKKLEGIVPRLFNSRSFCNSLTTGILKKSADQREQTNQQINELIEISSQQTSLRSYIQKTKENTFSKVLSKFILSLHQRIACLKDEVQSLKAKNELEKCSIDNFLSFIQQNEERIKNHEEITQPIKNPISSNLEPLLSSYVKILKINNSLELQKEGYIREIHLLEQRQSIPESQTKPFVQGNQKVYPKAKLNFQKFEPRQQYLIRESQISLADRFLSPLKEILENRKEDADLRNSILNCEQKIQEIIDHNRLLQQKLLTLQANDKIIKEITARNEDLKQENERLKLSIKNDQEFLQIKKQNEVKQNQLAFERNEIIVLNSRIADYEHKIREITYVNSELNEKINNLKESHSQFSNIASSNLQLSEKINEIYERSTSRPLQNNEQQLMKQTEMMKQILTLKIESQSLTMSHIKEISSLKTQINSYQTIISKLEIDLIQKENQHIQQETLITSLNIKLSQYREVNIQLSQKIEQFQTFIKVETNNRYREGEQQLSRLKNQCTRIYTQLQKSSESLNAKNKELKSLEQTLKEQQEIIIGLKQERQRVIYEYHGLENKYSITQQQVSKYKFEVSQIKTQFHSIQLELHKSEVTKTHITQNTQNIQNELNQKQLIINSLMEQTKSLNASFTSQLQQIKQDYIYKQKSLEERLSERDLKLNKLQFELHEKMNTITSLQNLISLYSNNTQVHRSEGGQYHQPYSRDKEIQYLCEQIKSLEEFLNDITLQYHELELRYQEQRQKTSRSFLNLAPFSPEKLKEKIEYESGFYSERSTQKRTQCKGVYKNI